MTAEANANTGETAKIIIFALQQREMVKDFRSWRRRLAGFGMAIDRTDEGACLSLLPGRRKVCILPPTLCV